MIIAVDFDGTIVSQDRDYEDLTTPLRFMPDALEALRALKDAGHQIIVYSARANLALRQDPRLDPLARVGKKLVKVGEAFQRSRELNEARYVQMLEFIDRYLGDIVDSVDDGLCGKVSADLYIDDKAIRLGHGPGAMSWLEMAEEYGDQRRSR